jgi:hypothetical protein
MVDEETAKRNLLIAFIAKQTWSVEGGNLSKIII